MIKKNREILFIFKLSVWRDFVFGDHKQKISLHSSFKVENSFHMEEIFLSREKIT